MAITPTRSTLKPIPILRSLALGLAASFAGQAVLAQGAQDCHAPEWAALPAEPLPALARKLATQGAPVTIVVLGPLPGGGRARESGAVAYPSRLQALLGEAWPGRSVKVESIGKSRGNVHEQRALIDKRVLPLAPELVIWQIGRADARGAVPSTRFGQELLKGTSQLKSPVKPGVPPIDAILMTMQFHPNSEALYRTDEYRNVIAWVGRTTDTTVVDRFTLIEHWWNAGSIDLDSQDPQVQKADSDWVQRCVAERLAATVIEGVAVANASEASSTPAQAVPPDRSGNRLR